MRFVLRAALVLLTLALPVTLVLPSAPDRFGLVPASGDARGLASACGSIGIGASMAVASDQGACCHFGGGICGCSGGRVQCCKGNLPSSCPCGPRAVPADRPVLRGPGLDGPPLRLREVAFTDKTTGPPLLHITSSKAGTPIWLWLELDCAGQCLDQLVTVDDPQLRVTVYWYFDPGSGPILRDDLRADQAVAPNPPPPRTAIPVSLPAGNWVAEIGYGADRICLKDDTTCSFRLRVTK